MSTLANIKIIKTFLNKYDISPSKKFGQNYLIDEYKLNSILSNINITKNDIVLEIGPGMGIFTYEFCKYAKKVYLIEIDQSLKEVLTKVLENYSNYEIFWEDATKFDYSKIKEQKIKVFSSLPYNSAKKIIMNLLESTLDWTELHFILQKEVVESYISTPPKADFLANYIRLFGKPRIEFVLSPKSFYPEPKVYSAYMTVVRDDEYKDYNRRLLASYIKYAFSEPRKKVKNNLRKIILDLRHIPSEILDKRPSELMLQDWVRIFKGSI
ncbi:MAG: 16S rRNA (adenine(1518)-N(6)/adenine(1519)-N(6))-dimethyltransferase RsmA [Candidatus Dojkabacteria bacterium]|nr:16S rRNA (adenine(1518)-N(6)/adenine(1519)-N(6))-dimethyltransferase RsmA [Candidatus Dojkabacteria bacterium]